MHMLDRQTDVGVQSSGINMEGESGHLSSVVDIVVDMLDGKKAVIWK